MTDRTVDILARTLWAEARSEGRGGMEAVASVVLNRAAHPRWWGHDIGTVCLKPRQFSCWNRDDPQFEAIRRVTIADPLFQVAHDVAAKAVAGEVLDRTGGADSYYAPAACATPVWGHGPPCAVLGAHRFFRVELPPPAPLKPAPSARSTADLNAAELARVKGKPA